MAAAAGARRALEPDELFASPAAALRTARAALEAGEPQRGIALLAAVSQREPIVADYADLERARALLESDETAQSIAVVLEALQEHSQSPLRADLFRLLGDARQQFGDEEGARAAWRAALGIARRGPRQSGLRLELAESYERSGSTSRAAETYRELWSSHPTSSEAAQAATRLDALEAAGQAPGRDAAAWRRRADGLFRAHHNGPALDAYDRALALGLKGGAERRARMQRAHLLFRMRRYPEAVEAFRSLPQTDEVRLWHARSLARVGDVPRSVEEFEALSKRTKGELRVRSLYLAALLLDGRDQHVRAREHFDSVASSRGAPGLAGAAQWRLAWSAYRDSDFEQAAERLGRLGKYERDPIAALRWRYWRARSLEQLGDVAGTEALRTLALEFPFTYYGWRASHRAAGPEGENELPEISRGKSVLAPSDIARPRLLLEAGWDDEAAAELDRAARRARSLDERLELAQLLADSGNFHGAQRVVTDPYVVDLARGPVPQLEDLWWHAWPTAYADQVARAAERGGIPPELVYSIMREESGYRPKVLSFAGAYGLLQIMPTTGERLARDVGRDSFDTDDLLDPDTNIELGSHYLGQLSERFDGRLSAAIASYNAGPNVVSEWVERDRHMADDEWVEEIPYDQTRRYVKRVLRSLHAYRVLY